MKMNRISRAFVNGERHARRNIEVLEKLLSGIDLEGVSSALEIGCGGGKIAEYLSAIYRLDVVGIDVDPEQIRVARQRSGSSRKNTFMVASATDLPFEDSTFDLILSQKVLHHISGWDKVLDEIGRVASRKSTYLFDDFAYPIRAAKLLKRNNGRYGIYSIDEVIAKIGLNGFEVALSDEPRGLFFKEHFLVFRRD